MRKMIFSDLSRSPADAAVREMGCSAARAACSTHLLPFIYSVKFLRGLQQVP